MRLRDEDDDDGGRRLDDDPFRLPTWVPETWSPPMAGVVVGDDHRPPPPHAIAHGSGLVRSRRPAHVIRITGRRRFRIGSSPGAATTRLPLARPQDVTGWTSGTLVLRVHDVVGFPPSSSLSVQVRRAATSPDDPSILFASSVIAWASVLSGGLKLVAWSGVVPACVSVVLVSSPDKDIEGTQDVTLSIDLLGRFG